MLRDINNKHSRQAHEIIDSLRRILAYLSCEPPKCYKGCLCERLLVQEKEEIVADC